MNVLLTNDDGYEAPGIQAAFEAVSGLGTVHVVAPRRQCSACSHQITLRRPITAERSIDDRMGPIWIVDGTPADCVRLGIAELVPSPIDLVVAGINSGANCGVDVYYSGTVAAAREGAIASLRSIALSHATNGEVDVDWSAAANICAAIIRNLMGEALAGKGFWSVNLPVRLTSDAADRIQRVPVSPQPTPMQFERTEHHDGKTLEFNYDGPYWSRETTGRCDYDVVRNGGISISTLPLFAEF